MRGLLALLTIVMGTTGAPLPAITAAPALEGETSTARSPVPAPAQEIRLGRKTMRMTVPVTVAGRGPYDFVIDTGAERSVLSRELASALELDPGPDARLLDFAGAATVATVKVPSLVAGTLATNAIEAPSLAMADIGAQGMLGIDALQGHKVVLDFDRGRMLLTPAKRHPDGDVRVRAALRRGQLIVTKAWFEGKPIAVVIDTGSWISVGNSAMLALAKKRPKLIAPIAVQAVSGRYFRASYVTVNGIKIGGINFDNFAIAFADAPPFESFGLRDKPALILGLGSLRSFRRVEMDFVNREIGFSLPRPAIDFNNLCRSASPCRSYP